MIDPHLYFPIFIYTTLLLCFVKSGYIFSLNSERLLRGNNSDWSKVVFWAICLIIFLGTRPISGVFVDTINYNEFYESKVSGGSSGEFIWNSFWETSIDYNLSFELFIFLVECIYIIPMIIAIKRLSKNNSYLILLFVISSFSFFSYGVNGIRNGAACSLVILALTYLPGNYKDKIKAIILCVLAFGIHKSTALPSLCMLLGYYVVKDVRWAMAFWVIAIIVSALFGSQVAIIFTGLGFDDRLDSYISGMNDAKSMAQFSQTGFRWDFLLYSAMPIWLGWYIAIRRKIYDRQYLLLLNTYILANAFWVMVITAAFSNRFAYLSWFMYPLLLAYPLVKFKIWKNQGEITALILMGHIGFTYIMYLIG